MKPPRHHHTGRRRDTKFIQLDSHKCEACWKCVEVCPEHVLGRIIFLNHRHARIENGPACNGCRKCARICPSQAIRYIYKPPLRLAGEENP